MTQVRLALSAPTSDGTGRRPTGSLEWRPTKRRNVTGDVVLPAPFTVGVGATTPPVVTVAPTEPGWAWAVVERVQGGSPHKRILTVPDSVSVIDYANLVEVDPATLDPVVLSSAWWTQVTDYVTTGLAGKVNSSTYTAGLAAKQDVATLGATVAADATVRAALVTQDTPGYDVILCAGQSNMAGAGAAIDTAKLDLSDMRIWQYAASGSYPNQLSVASEPLGYPAGSSGSPTTGMGPALVFARWYSQFIAPARRVLLVPQAVPGTGFAGSFGLTSVWDPAAPAGTSFYETSITQTQAALAAAGSGARFAAVLWLQGEQDASLAVTGSTYQAYLDALIDGYRTRLGDVPFVLGQMTPDSFALEAARVPINAVHVDTPRRKLRTGFAYGPAGMTNSVTGLDLTNVQHYNAPAQRIIGRRMFDAYLASLKNVLGGPVPDAPVVTVTQSGTTLLLSWVRPAQRVTGYTVQYRLTGAGSWTALTHSTIDITDTITGITPGQSYDVRVAASNETGTGAYGTTTLATIAVPGQVTGLAAGTLTSTSAPLSWSATASATGYRVDYKKTSDSTWTTAATPTGVSYTVTGLIPGTSYDFRVAATNIGGAGIPSATVTASTATLAMLLAGTATTAWRAYGLRQLSASYSGPAIQARRSTDDALLDIGFVGGTLDTTALLSHAGGASCYVAKLYDQSGNARHITSPATSNQPRIVNAGVVDTNGSGGKPCLVFDGVDDYFIDTTAGLYAAGAMSAFYVESNTANNGNLFTEGRTGNAVTFYPKVNSATPGIQVQGRNDGNTLILPSTTGSIPAINFSQVSMVDTGSVFNQYVNGTSAMALSYTRAGTFTLTNFTIGAYSGTAVGSFSNMKLSEIAFFTAALSDADRTALAANQKSFFGTP